MKQNAVSRAATTFKGEKSLLKYCNKCKMSINIPEMETMNQVSKEQQTQTPVAACRYRC